MSHYVDFVIKVREEALDHANAVIQETLEATRTFKGNLSATALRSAEDATVYNLLTVWEQSEDHAAYAAFRSTEEGAAVDLAALLAEAPTSGHWDALPAS
ncbi:antibiotic biosynthesis monooxygenase family protein [Streptomyces sp. NPDC001663]|uniref:antibiotic biosynthesis monooxygenase family protein n=1 Tax=Streptomyces sp. NPDC001663 TaxID=3364597 RepID=UPI0036866914